MAIETPNIDGRALLVSLKISTWSARKYDKKVSAEVAESHRTDLNVGRYSKALLPAECDSYKAATKAAGAIRAEHYKQTLAWADEGARLLPTSNFDAYKALIGTLRNEFERAAARFATEYPDLRESARARLNGMYREEDYPDDDAMRDLWACRVDYSPLPQADFRITKYTDTLGRSLADMERAVQSRATEATRLAMGDAWNRLYEAVNNMQSRLAVPDAIFRDSLVTNVREVTDILSRLNVTGDPYLERLREQAASALTAYSADTLRENEGIRAEVAQAAGEIVSEIQRARRYIERRPAPTAVVEGPVVAETAVAQ